MYTRIRKRPMSEINVVPYIDVMLVLLVIFMVTTPLLSQGVKVDLPKVTAQLIPPSEQEPVVVNVDRQGLFYINYGDNPKQPVADAELLRRVRGLLKLQPETPLLVGADAEVNYGKVMQLMVLLQQAGARDFGMLTQTPEPDDDSP